MSMLSQLPQYFCRWGRGIPCTRAWSHLPHHLPQKSCPQAEGEDPTVKGKKEMTYMSINKVLFCFRTHNNLYMPEMVARLGDTFAKALDMLEVEKNAILGKRLG